LKILYITRHFNRSGYYILQNLINYRREEIIGVVLHKRFNLLDSPVLSNLEMLKYFLETKYYNCDSCRFTRSITKLARKNNLKIINTADINSNEFYGTLKELDPDIIILGGGWHQLISQRVLTYPKLGAVNTHPSLLPNFRGTDVHRWQILEGVNTSGVTIHYMDPRFDTGDIIAKKSLEVLIEDTPQSLFEKISQMSANLMLEVLDAIENSDGFLASKSQYGKGDPNLYYHKWDWNGDLMRIDWNNTSLDIYNLIRASNQESYKFKGAYFVHKEKRYIIRRASLGRIDIKADEIVIPGEICEIDSRGFGVMASDPNQILVVERIQKDDEFRVFRRARDAKTFIDDNRLKIGDIIG